MLLKEHRLEADSGHERVKMKVLPLAVVTAIQRGP